MSYRCPPVSAIVPLFSVERVVGPVVDDLLTVHPQPDAVVADRVERVGAGELRLDLAVQRALNVSAPIAAAGEPVPQAKSTVGSTRVTVAPVKSRLSK